MNGAFLVVLGAIWDEVRLSASAKIAAFWAALYGTYANWFTTTLAAVFGTAALSPITANGHSALPWQEALVTIGFATVGLAMVAATALALWGVRRSAVA
jgi:hydroxylaminobenzene mutase